jgi:uroporphyrinogen-III synthase
MQLFSIGETTSNELKNYTKEKIFTSEGKNLASVLELIKKEVNSNI